MKLVLLDGMFSEGDELLYRPSLILWKMLWAAARILHLSLLM
jgi:hypothetical protein